MRVIGLFCTVLTILLLRLPSVAFTQSDLYRLLESRPSKAFQCSLALVPQDDELKKLNNRQLKKMLYEMATQGQKILGYKAARQLILGQIFLEEIDGEFAIRDIYCLKWFSNRDFGGRDVIGPNRLPEPQRLNVEHAWPQSRFNHAFSYDMQKSDLHHLFPADSRMNSVRSSFKFGEIQGLSQKLKCQHSRVASTPEGYRFEPPPEYKGRIARAMFYFAVRYRTNIDKDEEKILRKWHREFPVNEEERILHENIYAAQGNRNPFIDYPELVSLISKF